jgi:hypothetical protein
MNIKGFMIITIILLILTSINFFFCTLSLNDNSYDTTIITQPTMDNINSTIIEENTNNNLNYESNLTEPTQPDILIQEKDKWDERMLEYPIATQVWLYMHDTLGWNDYVCAGIMGNMMAECGGHTLNLNPTIRNPNSNCYGLCQWHPLYYPQLQNTSLEFQLNFLSSSVKEVFNGWAGQLDNINYNDFISLTNYSLTAKYFNDVYERPGYYSPQREKNAQIAYEYFVD